MSEVSQCRLASSRAVAGVLRSGAGMISILIHGPDVGMSAPGRRRVAVMFTVCAEKAECVESEPWWPVVSGDGAASGSAAEAGPELRSVRGAARSLIVVQLPASPEEPSRPH